MAEDVLIPRQRQEPLSAKNLQGLKYLKRLPFSFSWPAPPPPSRRRANASRSSSASTSTSIPKLDRLRYAENDAAEIAATLQKSSHTVTLLVTQDPAEAVAWFRQAAEQELPVAQYNLSMCYHQGYGVPMNLAEARTGYRKAAQLGHENARKTLANLGK